MNWLIYVSGGILFTGFGVGFINAIGNNKERERVDFIAFACIWVWICWRFIR